MSICHRHSRLPVDSSLLHASGIISLALHLVPAPFVLTLSKLFLNPRNRFAHGLNIFISVLKPLLSCFSPGPASLFHRFFRPVAIPPVPPPTVSSPKASLPTALVADYPASPALHDRPGPRYPPKLPSSAVACTADMASTASTAHLLHRILILYCHLSLFGGEPLVDPK